jgi:uncharacterized repeat protein (TIGR03987 family)
MNSTLMAAIVFIVCALLFYSISIWSTKITKKLKLWHVVLSWLGFACDFTGTMLMSILAGKWEWNLHGITGAAAIVLMLGTAIWMTYTYVTKKETLLASYHKFSIVVWVIWLIPFVGGMAGGM